jgi:hypothetical protein
VAIVANDVLCGFGAPRVVGLLAKYGALAWKSVMTVEKFVYSVACLGLRLVVSSSSLFNFWFGMRLV